MAWNLPDKNGVCCTCAEKAADPCLCAGSICIPVGLECRTRDGLAELCGYSEYTSPSVPPRKFRRETQDRRFVLQRFTDTSCSIPLTAIARTVSVPTSGSIFVTGTRPDTPGSPSTVRFDFTAGTLNNNDILGCSSGPQSSVAAALISCPAVATGRRFRRASDGFISYATPAASLANVGTWTAALVLGTGSSPPSEANTFEVVVIGSLVIQSLPLYDWSQAVLVKDIDALTCAETIPPQKATTFANPATSRPMRPRS
jgi:hypothetical protein